MLDSLYFDDEEVVYDLSEFDEYLESIRCQYNINVRHIYSDDTDPSVAIPSKRKIMLNDNYETNISPSFQLAHEIGHVLLFSDSTKLYGFSELVTKQEEKEAHIWAIKAFYEVATKNDFLPSYVSVMTALSLPYSFEPLIKKVWESFSL